MNKKYDMLSTEVAMLGNASMIVVASLAGGAIGRMTRSIVNVIPNPIAKGAVIASGLVLSYAVGDTIQHKVYEPIIDACLECIDECKQRHAEEDETEEDRS